LLFLRNNPVVFGAEARFLTELEKEKYDERVEQIGREMLYAFSKL